MPSTAINFAYTYPSSTLSSSSASSLFSSYQTFGLSSAPSALGISYTIGPGGSIELSGVYYGSMDEYESVMGGFVGGFPEGYQSSVQELSWIESLQDLAGGQSLDTMDGGSDSVRSHSLLGLEMRLRGRWGDLGDSWLTRHHSTLVPFEHAQRDDFSAKSLMTPSDVLISDDALNAFFNFLFTTDTSTNWFGASLSFFLATLSLILFSRTHSGSQPLRRRQLRHQLPHLSRQ